MLTKNLIRYSIRGNRVYPRFIDSSDPRLLAVAEELIELFRGSVDRERDQLLQESALVVESDPAQMAILRGLEKLLLDRTEFDTAPREELETRRAEIFSKSAELLTKTTFTEFAEYDAAIAGRLGQSREALAEHLYSDLPQHQRITKFRALSAERLLQRYNVAQVQGLLINSATLQLDIHDASPAQFRQLCKYLRFRQLLAEISRLSDNHFQIAIDGPLNLFFQVQKYGLSLALFFPAVLHMPAWELTAAVRIKKRKLYQLVLDHKSRLRPVSHQFLAFVPPEVDMFMANFREKEEEWEIAAGDDFLALPGEAYCFPDFQLRHHSGYKIALELFHPWHSRQLLQRLKTLESRLDNPPLLLGVSRNLIKKEHMEEEVTAHPYFKKYGILFRSIPTVNAVLKILKSLQLPSSGR